MTYTEVLKLIQRDRVRRSRKGAIGRFLRRLILVGLSALLDGWVFMLTVDVIRENWISQLPGIGFWWAVFIVWVLRAVFRPLDLGDKS